MRAEIGVSMNKSEFVRQLRIAAEELKPLTVSVSPDAATWNGVSYVRGEAKSPNPYALAWWSILNTVADLLEAQETSISPKQIAYLDRTLFGGMGSFNDLSFPEAHAINVRLDEKRRDLFSAFRE